MTVIEHAKVVLETGILYDGVVLLDGDRIAAVGKRGEVSVPADARRIDAQGLYVGPGFVDIHVHGGNGSFFYARPEEAAKHFLSHGETSILATLYYDLPKEEFLAAIDRVKAAMGKGAAKAIAGFYMEGPYMNPKYGASPEKNRWKGEIKAEDYTELVDRVGALAKVWAVAPEREGLEPFVQYAARKNPGVTFAVGHSEATPEQIARYKKYGLSLQTHCMNATGRTGSMAGTRGIGPDEACMLDSDMYAEVICDSQGIHVCPEILRLVLKTKGLDRTILISDSFVSSKTPPEHLRHVPDLVYDANGNLSGSKLTLDVACRNLMSHTNCGIAQAFLLAARNPARSVGLDREVGSIAVGKKANLVFVDDTFQVHQVILEGTVQERNV